MTRLPWDPAEIGTHDADLDDVAARLTRYADSTADAPPASLIGRIEAALDDEPIPAAPWWRAGGLAAWGVPARILAAAAVLVLGIVTGLALGQLSGLVQDAGTGSSPAPVISDSPSPSPSPSPTPTPSPSPTASPTPSPSPATPEPTASEDETPEPFDDSGGNSGPGGGGGSGGNSGPGGGGDSP
jgi:hypothetical protein